MVADHHHSRPGLLVDPDFSDLCRAECLGDQLSRVLAPLDNVHLLGAQLIDHLADPRAPGTDAGALGVDVGLVRGDRDLGPVARLAGDRLDLDRPVEQFGNLELEQPAD